MPKPALWTRNAWMMELGHYAKRYDHKDIELNTNQYIDIMLSRTNMMFEYENFPRTMPPSMFEMMLQVYGSVVITSLPKSKVRRYNNSGYPIGASTDMGDLSPGTTDEDAPDLYCFRASLGGEPDVYFQPTRAIIANPSVTETLELKIGEECVLCRSDLTCSGLLPIFSRYAFEMAHADITLVLALINSRMQTTITANTGKDFESAIDYIKRLTVGDLSAIATRPFLEGVSVNNANNNAYQAITGTLDVVQALKVGWYNELGVDPNLSLKREYVSAEELAANTDVLMPLVDNMLMFRVLALQQANEMYGTNMKVKKSSSWERKELESTMRLGLGTTSTTKSEGGEQSGQSGSEVPST